ncbi:hypothetical protein LY474_22080 [Myxococcus stipitatus]|uniref:hypothetical protein n=1 Tax=Myxococcus stipitatus TaxID=83455 RepID=UPI001F324DFE|nr:hypothetical protein [Myxococcus stipitatus]MCE9670496.1 hypothetical protein [Myxococcus stipitatus]
MPIELRIRIEGEEHTLGTAISTTVRNMDDGEGHEVLVRVGDTARLDLAPGNYLVEASLPSGERLRRLAHLREGDTSVDVDLKPTRTANAKLSRQHLFVPAARLRPAPPPPFSPLLSFSGSTSPVAPRSPRLPAHPSSRKGPFHEDASGDEERWNVSGAAAATTPRPQAPDGPLSVNPNTHEPFTSALAFKAAEPLPEVTVLWRNPRAPDATPTTAALAGDPALQDGPMGAPLEPSGGNETLVTYELPLHPDFLPATGTFIVRWDHQLVLVPVARWAGLPGSSAEAPIEFVVNLSTQTVSAMVADPIFGPILGYLTSGQLEKAAHTLRNAVPLSRLEGNEHDPFAAAISALVLARTMLTGNSEHEAMWHDWLRFVDKDAPHLLSLIKSHLPKIQVDWRRWVHLLATWTPNIPDTAILEGWLRLTDEQADTDAEATQALACFLQAHERGVPYFSVSLRMLLDGLLHFDPATLAKEQVEPYRKALRTVRQWATWVDAREPFTTLRIPRED